MNDLLNKINIFDEFDEERVEINWTCKDGKKIFNSINFFLINRVLSIPEEMFHDFSEEDRQYSISEFRAYLAFPNSYSRPGAFGLSGNRFSLPRQWETVKKASFRFITPHYYLGNMDYCTLYRNLIYTHPFDFYFWKSNKDLIDVHKKSFVFFKLRLYHDGNKLLN